MSLNHAYQLRKLRSERGLSQLDLEIRAGFCPGIISRIERSKVNPSKETLYKIAIALELDETECAQLFCLSQVINTLNISPTRYAYQN